MIWKDDEPWWVLADVCRALGIQNSWDVVKPLDDDEKGVSQIYTLGGPQQMTIINESGLYSVILRSVLPFAGILHWFCCRNCRCHWTEYAQSGTGNCSPQRQARSGSAQGYCRGQECLWDLWSAGRAGSLLRGWSADRSEALFYFCLYSGIISLTYQKSNIIPTQ